MITIKSQAELETMREAGRIVALALEAVSEAVAPGVTTAELDLLAEELIRNGGAEPSFKGYRGFPATLCLSVNEEVVHGIPGARRLKGGDLLKVDCGAYFQGYHGDAAISVPVGEVSRDLAKLAEATRTALFKGIEQTREGAYLTDISHAIESYAQGRGYSVVRDYAGHGLGRALHEDPEVPNYGPPGRGPKLRAGMVLCIEPMLNIGAHEVDLAPDGWTVVTKDGMPSSHFEHTVAVTAEGPWVLTER